MEHLAKRCVLAPSSSSSSFSPLVDYRVYTLSILSPAHSYSQQNCLCRVRFSSTTIFSLQSVLASLWGKGRTLANFTDVDPCFDIAPDWQDERPPAPSYLRILHLGKILQDDDTLLRMCFRCECRAVYD